MPLDKKTLDKIFAKNILLMGQVHAPWGSEDIYLDKDELEKFIEDFPKFCSDHFGLTPEQYQKWMEFHGAPQCGEKTKKGVRCKKKCGSEQLRSEAWLEQEGGICAYHERQKWREKLPIFGN